LSLNGKHPVLLKRKAAFKIRGEAGILNNYLFQILPQLLEMPRKTSKIDWNFLTKVLLKHRNEIIILSDFRIISKHHKIWTQIVEELENIRNPLILYKYTVCNENGIRDKLNESLREDLKNLKEDEKRKAKESKVLSISVYICFLLTYFLYLIYC